MPTEHLWLTGNFIKFISMNGSVFLMMVTKYQAHDALLGVKKKLKIY